MTDLKLKVHEQRLLDHVKRSGERGVPIPRSIDQTRTMAALREAGLVRFDRDRQRWVTEDVPPLPATEATITLNLSEYEASVITGALAEFGERWPDETQTATYLRAHIKSMLPAEWND